MNKETIKQKITDELLKACKHLYDSELALCEPEAPQSWKDDAKHAWEEFVWRYQDFELINDSTGEIDENELNYNYN